jgi:tetratricopeptide (TPR) repeat protein
VNTDHLIHRKNVRGALKRLDPRRLRELAEEPLAELGAVEARRQSAGHPATAEGRARALRDLLTDALDSLKPAGDAEPDFIDPAWRMYLILNEQYVKGGDPLRLAERMIIGRDTFNHSQAGALDAIVRWLRQANEAVEASVPRPPAFNAPALQGVKVIGREAMLGELKARLLAGQAIGLSGLPGAGKSTLAAAIANDAELLAHFTDGVLWAGLGQGGDALAWLGEWAAMLGVPRGDLAYMTTLEARTQAVHGAISTRRLLLVIDDAWNSEAALALRVGGPNCAHLLTARAASVALDFAGSNALQLPELDESSGLALLVHHAPEAAAYEPEAVKMLAQAVGGLPLALMLMGRHLHRAGRGGQKRRLREALEALRTSEARLALTHRDPPHVRKPELPNEASLAAVIGLSEAMLDEPSRRAWYALSVFPSKPNTFSEEAALVVASEPPEALDALVDAGVLEVEEGRYEMHRMLTDFGSMKQVGNGPSQRFCQLFVELVMQHPGDYHRLDLEASNILFALQLTESGQNDLWLVRGVVALFGYLEARGRFQEAEIISQRALIRAYESQRPEELSILLLNLGRIAIKRAEFKSAMQSFQQGLQIARQIGNQRYIAVLLQNLGSVQADTGHHEEAQLAFEDGLRLARSVGDKALTSSLLLHLASMMEMHGSYSLAKEYALEGLSLAQEAAQPSLIASHMAQLAIIQSKQGEFMEGASGLLAALQLAREVGNKELICILLYAVSLGAILFQRFVQAEELVREGLETAIAIGYKRQINLLYSARSLNEIESGRTDQALLSMEIALHGTRQVGHPWDMCAVLNACGRVCQLAGHLETSLGLFSESIALGESHQYPEMVGYAEFRMSQVFYKRGDISEASRHAEQSLATYTAINYWQRQEVAMWLENCRQESTVKSQASD